MKKIIECIPNFSEGRDQHKITQIVEAIKSVPGILFLGVESDIAHNRSVVTFAGEPEDVLQAAFNGIKIAAQLIDLNKHKGEHPRMGATDVCPLVPLKGVKMEECVAYAEKLAEKVAKELEIPVYLYEKAARKPERENLADMRKGEYEGIKKEIGKNPSRKPDFGPAKLGKAGITAIGAREPLVAYNVNLNTPDLKIAKKIAKTIRGKDGGFKYVKALGFMLQDRGVAQVSMNLVNYKKSTVHHVFEAIKCEAQKYGVGILESEIVGLIPEKALFKAAKYYLQLNGFKNNQILEKSVQKQIEKSSPTLEDFLDQTASKSPVPGGGSVAALSGSLAAALCEMVCNLTLNNKKYAKVHKQIAGLLEKSGTLRKKLYLDIEADAESYAEVANVYRAKDKNGKINQNKLQEALKNAALSPLNIAKSSSTLLNLIPQISKIGNQNALSDCGVALHMAEASVKGAILNIEINLKQITDKTFKTKLEKEISSLSKIFN
ncbi:glutamate formimidoyltransferase [Candidatus Peregrinibacteria bacterium]|nr:glutamate formimidoyltransferase [Candidatus Peregrinibacteria bacterium]